ncbi:mannosylglycoprotein endo-beta-mannosidase-like, partial [Trifolium medium]|nr:mannosylglycoprotein endo-beta-mannosidase-like [Trifolium medium]
MLMDVETQYLIQKVHWITTFSCFVQETQSSFYEIILVLPYENTKSVGDLSLVLRDPSPKDPSQYLDGTRIYIQGSMWDGFADGMGNFTDGPYEIQNPEHFFKDNFYNYGFNPEVGSVGMPVASTIRATMPSEGWQIPVFKKLSNGYVEEVPNPIWEYHKYIPYSKPNKVHDQIQLY